MIRDHDLYFLTPEFHPGINLTVRAGRKWRKAQCGDQLFLLETGEEHCIRGRAIVVSVVSTTYGQIPHTVLALEHDPACRTREGLTAAMRRAYPDAGPILDNDEMCLIFFYVD